MKLLISTPIFNGKVEIQYFASMLGSMPSLLRNKVEFEIMTEARNLIHQARNRAAHYAINNGFDKLLFIDADISWKPQDIINLLVSDKKVIGGLYPFKSFPIKLNFVPKQGIYETETFDIQQYVDDFADKRTGEVEVHMLPTGFMMVDVSVFKELEPHVETYNHRDQLMQKLEHEKMFFPFKIAEDGFLYTEDWGFCDLVRNKLGHSIYWNTKVIVDHVGSHSFSGITPIDQSYKHLDIHKNEQEAAANNVKNPFNKWPRNLSCFCGSGQKFKKCHENKLNLIISQKEYEVLKPDFDKTLAFVQKQNEQGIGYKLENPII